MKVEDIEARKNIIKKFGRCFVCIKKGHRAFDCRSRATCKNCKKRHHVSLCSEGVDNKGKDRSEPSAPPHVEYTTTASCIQGVESPGRETAALQTAPAFVNWDNNIRVRVLFDSGNQRSFVTPWMVGKFGVCRMRREVLGIKAFGGNEAEYVERDLVKLHVMNVKGGERTKISALSLIRFLTFLMFI